MNQQDSPDSRAKALWGSFAAIFGAESLKRKFGATPPAEWVMVAGQLKAYELERGMRRLLASGAKIIPTLPEFRRLCKIVANDDLDDAATQIELPQRPAPLMAQDPWHVASGRHLMGHLNRRLSRDPGCFGPVIHGENAGSMQQQACTAILVHWKQQWAQMMREEAVNGEMPVPYQREVWDSYMAVAEQQIQREVFGKAPS